MAGIMSESQDSERWILESPDGTRFAVSSIQSWCRDNHHRFSSPALDAKPLTRKIEAIAVGLYGASYPGRRALTYHGWKCFAGRDVEAGRLAARKAVSARSALVRGDRSRPPADPGTGVIPCYMLRTRAGKGQKSERFLFRSKREAGIYSSLNPGKTFWCAEPKNVVAVPGRPDEFLVLDSIVPTSFLDVGGMLSEVRASALSSLSDIQKVALGLEIDPGKGSGKKEK